MKPLFLLKELPVQDLQKIGLYQRGKPLLNIDDLSALLSGRRTDLVSLTNIQADGFVIKKLDAKLSLDRSADGKVSLKIHPIYKESQEHELLNEHEAKVLISGEIDSIRKVYAAKDGKSSKTHIIEYDAETKEFISYEPDHVLVPEAVNNEELTEKQKEDFRNGEWVGLSDGTCFQHRASQSKGILSDRTGLVLSVMLDGGLSYLIITGIRNLLGNRSPQKEAYTQGYAEALKHVEEHQHRQEQQQEERNQDYKEDYSRNHERGRSR